MTSIRSFLITVTLAAIVLVIFVATIQGYRAGIEQTTALLDTQLHERAQLLSVLVPSGEAVALGDATEYQILDADGTVLFRSAGAPEEALQLPAHSDVADVSFLGQRWRVVRFHDAVRRRTVLAAENVDDRYGIASALVEATLIPIVLGIPVLGLFAWLIISVGLRHLKSMEREVAERRPEKLSDIELPELPTELKPLLNSMNRMFGQVRASFEREQQFAGDAAHELRTPVSALKINVFNLSQKLGDDDADIQALTSSLRRQTHLIDQLLLLYRTSSENLRMAFEPVSLKQLCEQEIRERFVMIEDRRQDIALEGEDVTVNGNRFALSALIANLVDNASKYSPESASIRVRTGTRDGRPVLEVEDSGSGIPVDLRSRVGERFVRGRHAQPISGCGLGLSIVNHVVALHGADWRIDDSHYDSGTLMTIVFNDRTAVEL